MPARPGFAILVLAAGLGLAGTAPAQADPKLCTARIGGAERPLAYDPDEDGLRAHYSLREIISTTWSRGTCPGYVVLRALTPELTDAGRGPFCLQYDKESDSVIGYDLGRRDAYGHCKAPRKTVCQRVNGAKDAAVAIAGGAARRTFDGVQTARNTKAGAVVLSGSRQYVGEALGTIGGAAASLGSSPALLAGAAVSVVAVGGAVYACSGDPEAPAATE